MKTVSEGGMKTGKCEGGSNLTELPSLLRTVYYSFGNVKRHVSEEDKERKICRIQASFCRFGQLWGYIVCFWNFHFVIPYRKWWKKGEPYPKVTWIFQVIRPIHIKKKLHDNYIRMIMYVYCAHICNYILKHIRSFFFFKCMVTVFGVNGPLKQQIECQLSKYTLCQLS